MPQTYTGNKKIIIINEMLFFGIVFRIRESKNSKTEEEE